MKLLLDDKATRGYNLNANEACIFAAILKCSRAGRGWYGNYRELAAAMPFVISRMTTTRAVQKLITLGLVEERDNVLFSNVNSQMSNAQIEQSDAQIEHGNAQIEHDDAQIVLPPNNPPIIYNNMNEKEKEQPRALRTHDGEKQQGSNFEDFKKAFIEVSNITPQGGENWFKYRGEACEQRWDKLPELHRQAILNDLKRCRDMCEKPFKENPYFYLCDFPEPQPEFLSGLDQDKLREKGIPMVQVRYNGKFLICTRETMELFGLQWERDW